VKKRIAIGALVALGLTLAVVATALGGPRKQTSAGTLPSSSCGKLQYKGSGSPKFIIATDLPLQGANRALTTEMGRAVAFELNLQHWKAGKYTVGYQACDDSTAATGAWDTAKCSANASAYARDKSVIGVIGTFNSGCAKLIIPVLNRAPGGSVAMISPANTYPGLTIGGPGTAPGEPKVYYPTGKRNYARVVWTDRFQGAADAIFTKTYLHLKKPYVLTDGQTYGLGIATLYRRALTKLGVKTVGFHKWDPNATSYESVASAVKSSHADGVFLGGVVCLNGGKVIKDLRARLGKKFPILVPDGFVPPSATFQTSGGTSNGGYMSYAGIPVTKLRGAGAQFVSSFKKANGGKLPEPYSAYAAQAAQIMLKAIAKSNGTRSSVSKGLFNLKINDGILGKFTIDGNGDTSLGIVTFGRYSGPTTKFIKLITPPLSFTKG